MNSTIIKMVKFEELGLSKDTLSAIKKKGFSEASEIQEKVIPLVLERKHDIIGVSQTGSGKTAGFGLPIIDLLKEGNKTPKSIILAPTRELALQVTAELETFSSNRGLKFLTVYGGSSIQNQIKDLKRGVDVVVGTPGRVLDLLDRRALKLNQVEYFVLDEADEMLRMGFIDDVETILKNVSDTRRVLLFSATMPERIKKLSKKYMKDQKIVEVKHKIESKANIKQEYFVLRQSEKFDSITRIIDGSDFFYGIIFCMTRDDVNELTSNLKEAGYDVDCIHGDIIQSKREKILKKFRDLKINILVATDVAARGIDVNDLTHVINHSLPKEMENYVHRIGRTGRAGKSGTAISFLSSKQKFLLKEMEKVTKGKVEKGVLPNGLQILEKKKDKIRKDIGGILNSNKNTEFYDFASELIEEFGADNVVSALLLKDQGSVSVSDKPNKKQKDEFVRLFVAKGKDDGFNKRRLFTWLEKEAGTKIDGDSVKVNGKFSFVNVPSSQADKILKAFGKRKGRPLVEKASSK